MTSPFREGSRSPLRASAAFSEDVQGLRQSFSSMMSEGALPARPYSASRRGDVGSLVVDDLLQGMNEWRNIQVARCPHVSVMYTCICLSVYVWMICGRA